MNTFKNVAMFIAFPLLIFGALAWVGQSKLANKAPSAPASSLPVNQLTTDSIFHDFGSISMKNGNVMKTFTVKNTQNTPMTITKLQTSCMCTKAILKTKNGNFGPFGMPGHGMIPTINAVLQPNEEANVEVVFDPNAHGPAGVGRIERAIFVETDPMHQPLTLKFSTTVTP